VKVLWTDSAVAQLQALHDYIAQTSPEYARQIVKSVDETFHANRKFSLSGRMVPEYEINEVREVIDGRYRIIYLIGDTYVHVLALIHEARDIHRL
jgi:toxin ParE1/3/4